MGVEPRRAFTIYDMRFTRGTYHVRRIHLLA